MILVVAAAAIATVTLMAETLAGPKGLTLVCTGDLWAWPVPPNNFTPHKGNQGSVVVQIDLDSRTIRMGSGSQVYHAKISETEISGSYPDNHNLYDFTQSASTITINRVTGEYEYQAYLHNAKTLLTRSGACKPGGAKLF